MRLYSHDASPFAARVRIQIRAKDLPVRIEAPPMAPGSAQLRDWSATGRIPILELASGALIPESRVIMEYLEDRFPTPSLRGRTCEQTARVRLIGQLVDIYLVPALQPLRSAFRAKTRVDGSDEDARALDAALGYLEHYMSDGQFAVGDELTLADCTLVPMLFYVDLLAAAVLPDFKLSTWPRVERCYRSADRHGASQAVLHSMHEATRSLRA